MNNMKLSFKLTECPCTCTAEKDGRTTLSVTAENSQLSCSVLFDYRDQPLTLRAKAKKDDDIALILMPHRMELYVNGTLEDEEWPKGSRFLDLGDTIDAPFPTAAEEYTEPAAELPAVVSVFKGGAEGWRPSENVFVGDCMPYVDNGRYHVLYLKDRHHHRSKWHLGAHQWEHISTSDFDEWQVHPMAVPITDPMEGSICTGSWMRHGDTHYLYYTIRRGDGIPATIARSVSHDGYHFGKDADFGFTIGDHYNAADARDPKIIKGEDGRYHMLLTTSITAERKGCLCHLVSDDLDRWEDTGVPMYIAPDEDEPECPDYIFYNGRYYLFFGTRNGTTYLISENPFDGWRVPKNRIIPCGNVPKGAVWNGKIIFTGFRCIDGYAGNMIFLSAHADEDGELVFE